MPTPVRIGCRCQQIFILSRYAKRQNDDEVGIPRHKAKALARDDNTKKREPRMTIKNILRLKVEQFSQAGRTVLV